MNSLPLITTLAMALGLALILGFIASRLKLPTIFGYLLAGVLLGPFTPGIVANGQIAHELAEIGIMLLMFGVGLNFSWNDLLEVRGIALPGAIVQIIIATLLGATVAMLCGCNDIGQALVFGLALSVASTVVLLRALEDKGILKSMDGRIAIGWLIVEDLVMVLVLVLLPPLAAWLGTNASDITHKNLLFTLGLTVVQISAFLALMLIIGRRLYPKLLWHVAQTNSRELFTLCVVATAVGIAYGAAKLFGVSFALGAFFAGMLMRESEFSHRAARESLPLREAFAVLFFVSVGMLFNPQILIEHPLQVLAVVSIIVIGKSVAAFLLVMAFRYPLSSALVISASLAQIGEFSFILAELSRQLGLLSEMGKNYILAGALISIALNPLIFKLINPLENWLKLQAKRSSILDKIVDPLSDLTTFTKRKFLSRPMVLIGYGRVGRSIAKALSKKNIPYVVVDQNRESIEELRKQGIPAICGDASDSAVLIQAHVTTAKILIIAIPDTSNVRQMIEMAHVINPNIETIVRTHNAQEAESLKENTKKVFFAAEELANNMSDYILERYEKLNFITN